ncbi:hypothetical protein [Fimbriiglobus ruber]|uniref:Uncharacterized protein n=1 Tax=Fimbriiglobus ruber TaxID=1908690 RepID=A0A225E0B2_9BACT|nr:hypothetical protein [Fimbriiglobus ruber]OWK42095.1 hypothetical protein FRUB_04173 [Fimbriiglobus ruber]
MDKNEPPLTPEQVRALFAEWSKDYAARKQINEGVAKESDDHDKSKERDGGREM